MPDTLADKLLCSVEISTNQLVSEVRKFESIVTAPHLRKEVTTILADTIVALAEIGHRLDAGTTPKPTTPSKQ